ncbi:hypothetical protein AMAG_12189 [Allomyces macrogynus ATCC 38327]|uniref:Uncharacterized protein n=1 Tax=Allomyces macrogynus (strain ATCC 38327) TaxID=578462 RepID=A0A0L0SXR6_ALLM3|nr:hypothetical protein AMAG_12189 [Allomyces macrogynus ATCC 38327]|eukprot:KNE67114.1 hypothetical protein AMAG_12189 [Allomyces macrogynus ATCC 38327]
MDPFSVLDSQYFLDQFSSLTSAQILGGDGSSIATSSATLKSPRSGSRASSPAPPRPRIDTSLLGTPSTSQPSARPGSPTRSRPGESTADVSPVRQHHDSDVPGDPGSSLTPGDPRTPHPLRAPAAKNWDKVRTALLPEKTINVFEIFGGKNKKLGAPIPYTISLYQGIQFKYAIKAGKRAMTCGHIHERLVVGGTLNNVALRMQQQQAQQQGGKGPAAGDDRGVRGLADAGGPGLSAGAPNPLRSQSRARAKSLNPALLMGMSLTLASSNPDGDSDSDSDSVRSLDSIDLLLDESAISKKGGDAAAKTGRDATSKTMAVPRLSLSASYFDDKNSAVIQDVSKGVPPFRTLVHAVVPVQVAHFIPVVQLGLYVGCSHDDNIKLFNSKFEHIRNVLAWAPVIRVQWIDELCELLAFGTKSISFWTLETRVDRGEVKADATQIGTIEFELEDSEWVGEILYEPLNQRFYVLIGSAVHVYSAAHDFLFKIESPSPRLLTCMAFHPDLHYLFVGVSDGTIQVWNLTNTMIHEFSGHLKAITALVLFNSSLILSSSRDGSIRLWNISTFRQWYCLQVREDVMAVGLIDPHHLWTQSSKGLSTWGINMINQTFSYVNSNVTFLRMFKTGGIPARVLVGSDDGVWRILSPVTGKVLTTCIPIHQNIKVKDASYSPRTQRLYFLMETGDIWVAETHLNPSVIVEHWKLGSAAKEDCCCISIFDGVMADDRPCTLLFGGTGNGQIIVYTQYGTVGKRVQVHTGQILRIVPDVKENLVASLGTDNVVRISQVCPDKKDILFPRVTVPFQARPTTMCVSDFQLLVGTDEGVMSLLNFNPRTGEYRAVPPHARNDDHGDAVIGCTFRKRWGLYVTLGADGVIKVWDTGSVLVREIQFDEPPSFVCIASSWVDLLVVWENRVDIIRYFDYLPPGYAQSISSAFHKSNPPEEPLPLEQNQELIRLVAKKGVPTRPGAWLEALNLAGVPRPESPTFAAVPVDANPAAFGMPSLEHDMSDEASRPRSVSQGLLPSILNRGKSPSLRSGRRPNTALSFRQFDDTPPTVMHLSIQESEALVSTLDLTLERYTSVANITEIDLAIPTVAPHVPMAPDGAVPNSSAQKAVDEWNALHQPMERIVLKRKKKERPATVQEQEKRSTEYKSRLQRLLAMLPKRPAPAVSTPPAEPPAPDPANDPDALKKPKTPATPRRGPPPPPPSFNIALPTTEELPQPPEEEEEEPPDEDLPRLIQKAMEFHIFQEQQLFETKQGKNGRVRRTLMVDPTPDGLLPMMLNTFEKCDVLAKKEIAVFTNWMNAEFEFEHARRILDMYLAYLLKVYLDPVNDLEKELLLTLLSALNQFGCNDPDIISTLLLYTIYGDPAVEALAKQILMDLGFVDPVYRQFEKRIQDLFAMARQDAPAGSALVDTARKYILAWLRRIPQSIRAGPDAALTSTPASALGSETASGSGKRKKKGHKRKQRPFGVSSSMEDLARILAAPANPKGADSDPKEFPIILLMNQWVAYQKDRDKWLEQKRLEDEQRMREKEEADRQTAERLRLEQAALEAREAARRAKEEQKLRELEQARERLAAHAATAAAANRPPSRYSNPHYSTCHPSRESVQFRFHLPPLATASDADNLIALHLAKLNKSLPVELINPRPFAKSSRVSIRDPEFRSFAPPPAPPRSAAITSLLLPGSVAVAERVKADSLVMGGVVGDSDDAVAFATRKRYLVFDRPTRAGLDGGKTGGHRHDHETAVSSAPSPPSRVKSSHV